MSAGVDGRLVDAGIERGAQLVQHLSKKKRKLLGNRLIRYESDSALPSRIHHWMNGEQILVRNRIPAGR